MNVVAIVQARMASTRLPGKVLADVAGRPLLWHVLAGLKAARTLDRVVVAIPDGAADDALEAFCRSEKTDFFRGSERDVLDRFYRAALRFKADAVVRVTADCPLIDARVVDGVVGRFLSGKCDYASNVGYYTYPDGLDVEVFSFSALRKIWKSERGASAREHVTTPLRTSGRFRALNVFSGVRLHGENWRWSVDDRRDLEFVRDVAVRLGAEKMHRWEEVLAFLRKNPAVAAKNAGGVRNEGYYKSVASERPAPPLKRRPLKRSAALRARAEKLIPSCSQTFSKAPTQFVQGVTPVFLQRGKGGRVWDVDGNEYIDYPLALGPVILGHDHPDVTEAVRGQLKDGLSFSLPHPLEVELAELLAELIPCAEMVRYGKNGSDATAGAVRAARAFTGREKIACSGYHGWQDWFIGTTTRRAGVPVSTQALTLSFEYNDIAGLKRIFDQNPGEIAAVVMEPIGVVEPKDDFLQQVRELTKARGALLVFDEIVTGFRLDLGGAQKHFGVVPDLACFGKAMANGFPLAAVVGRRDVMKVFDEVFFSFTFGGEAAALAAAVATINVMKREPVIDHLWEMGQRLKDGYNVMARQLGVSAQTSCVGLAPHTVMTFGNADGKGGLILRSLLQQELVKRGVLFLTGHNVCYAHTPADIEQTLRAHRAALDVLARALKSGRPETFLEGEPVQAVFRKP